MRYDSDIRNNAKFQGRYFQGYAEIQSKSEEVKEGRLKRYHITYLPERLKKKH